MLSWRWYAGLKLDVQTQVDDALLRVELTAAVVALGVVVFYAGDGEEVEGVGVDPHPRHPQFRQGCLGQCVAKLDVFQSDERSIVQPEGVVIQATVDR